jgi:O-succinylbenzoate synthase
MAKAGVEMAVWDAWAAETRRPLHELIGGSERDVEVGISLGMYADPGALRERVEAAKEQGYRRIKLKIAPGQDLVPIRTIREMFPELPLMADANSAYQMAQIERIRQMDEWRLMMIEQPLAYDDLVDHAALQSIIDTPICLDESIRSAEDVRRVADIGACRIVNVKPGRLGGFSETIQLHETAVSNGIGLWCGGMYETGVGRLHNLAVCSLPGFLLPTDNGPSDRYFARDILTEPVRFSRPGYLTVEPMCGVATKVDWEMLDFITADRHVYRFDTSNRA